MWGLFLRVSIISLNYSPLLTPRTSVIQHIRFFYFMSILLCAVKGFSYAKKQMPKKQNILKYLSWEKWQRQSKLIRKTVAEEFAHTTSLPFLPSWTHMVKLDSWQSSHGSSAKFLTDLVSWIIILVSITQNNVILSMLPFSCRPPCHVFWRGERPQRGHGRKCP